jgi:hypothetical protein
MGTNFALIFFKRNITITFYGMILMLVTHPVWGNPLYLKGRFLNFAVVVSYRKQQMVPISFGVGWFSFCFENCELMHWLHYVAAVWSFVKYQLSAVNIYLAVLWFGTSFLLTLIGKIKEVHSESFSDFTLTTYNLNDYFNNAL